MSRFTQRSGFLALGAASLAVAATLAAVLVGGPSQAGDQAEGASKAPAAAGGLDRIVGTVGPGFTISVSPRRVQPGTYRLVVRDRSSMHNWHIRGSGVNKQTGIPFQGTRRFTIEVDAGRYRIKCDVHPTSMRTRLRVVS